MEKYYLDVDSPIVGGYFSSQQIDLLSIVRCNSFLELLAFVKECGQINHVDGILESITELDLESAKKRIFQAYQDTMIFHDQGRDAFITNRLKQFGVSSIEDVINGIHPKSEEILTMNFHFDSEEWDQSKTISYEEIVTLNSELPHFNSLLLGSGKIYRIYNKYAHKEENRFDFYHIKRDLDFAYKQGKQVRYHSLLVKETDIFDDIKTKEDMLALIRDYVKESIDFINEYNRTHKIIINGKKEPVINAVDLFNEIVSFDKNKEGEYYNIWDERFKNLGITFEDIAGCFQYAVDHKPKGVNYLYNEPFLEDDKRRKKVLEELDRIHEIYPGLIDTLGTQTHITITGDLERVRRCYEDLKKIQDLGMEIQITEFDMSLGRKDIEKLFGPNSDYTLEDVYRKKDEQVKELSEIIRSSGVELSGITYWSLTDGIDCNLERIRSNALKQHQITDVNQIPTACGGLIPTHKEFIKKKELSQMLDDMSKSESQIQANSNTQAI